MWLDECDSIESVAKILSAEHMSLRWLIDGHV
jgi:hypothetical protein